MADDRVLMFIASEKLANPDGLDLPPHVLREILARFLELAEQEAARRPPGRPKSDFAGQTVWVLMEGGWPQAAARKRAAKAFRKSLAAVARAHLRYRRETGQN
jgi:hypothetical protein